MTDHNYVYVDIETIPSQSPDLLAKFCDDVKAPAQYKKPESIAAWLDENREAVAQDRLGKTSFDPAHGHICTIAWAKDDGVTEVSHTGNVGEERDVLLAFFDSLDPYHSQTFVGHYISGFDLRFILCRAVVLGIQIPQCIPRDPKPWGGRVFDTMTAWAGNRDTISMDNLCAALGLKGKGDGLDGSQVAQAWLDGRHDEIAAYCRDDVERTRAIHQKFLAAGW